MGAGGPKVFAGTRLCLNVRSWDGVVMEKAEVLCPQLHPLGGFSPVPGAVVDKPFQN